MVLHIPLQFILQLLYFSILYIYQFPQPIKLSLEFLILRTHVLPEMTDLIIESLLEFIIYYLYLPVLLLNHMQEILSILLYHSFKPHYLIIFLFLGSLVLLEYSIINR
jgi:hypothetical protein